MIHFYKYQGTGNDFVIIDNRNESFIPDSVVIHQLCDRRFGIGADGLMELKNEDGFQFKMIYYNADGKEGSMCGNGGRCLVAFAKKLGIVDNAARFNAMDGEHEAKLHDDGTISLKMKNVHQISRRGDDAVLDTGSPHYVQRVEKLHSLDVFNEGRKIRNSPEFEASGINVNFVEIVDDHTIRVRTYERGVEDETFSCGTGVTASAIFSSETATGSYTKKVHTLGGLLEVSFDLTPEGNFENIWLRGPAKFVFEGDIGL